MPTSEDLDKLAAIDPVMLWEDFLAKSPHDQRTSVRVAIRKVLDVMGQGYVDTTTKYVHVGYDSDLRVNTYRPRCFVAAVLRRLGYDMRALDGVGCVDTHWQAMGLPWHVAVGLSAGQNVQDAGATWRQASFAVLAVFNLMESSAAPIE